MGDHGSVMVEVLPQGGQQRLVPVDEQGPARAQTLGDLQFGTGDVLTGPQMLQMGGAHVGDHGHVGTDGGGHGGDLPAGAHAHLQHRPLGVGGDLQEGEGQADGAVVVTVLLEHPAFGCQDGVDHFLGGGLAHASRHGHHGENVKIPLTSRACHPSHGLHGIGDQDGGIGDRRQIVGQPLAQKHRASQGGCLRDVIVPIHPLTADGAEQGIPVGLAGVGADMGNPHVLRHTEQNQSAPRHSGKGIQVEGGV